MRALLSPPRPLSWSGVRRQSTLVAVAVVGVALVAGTVVSALIVVALKRYWGRKELEQAEAAFQAEPAVA